MDSSTSKFSLATFRLTGTVAAEEQVLMAVTKVSMPFLQNCRGVIPVLIQRNTQ